MELNEAIGIVYSLAEQNALELYTNEPELKDEAERQHEALDTVRKWARHALDIRL